MTELVEDVVLEKSAGESSGAGHLDEAHAWEADYTKSWINITKDQHGKLVVRDEAATARKYPRNYDGVLPVSAGDDGELVHKQSMALKRGLLRFLYLVVDMSSAMQNTDYKQNRLDFVVTHLCRNFIPQYFDLNPISNLSVISLRDQKAHFVTRMSGQPASQVERVLQFSTGGVSGSASLVNALEAVGQAAKGSLPRYGTREVLIVWGSLHSVDPPTSGKLIPDCVERLIEEIKPNSVRVSVISLSPELYALRKVVEMTGGTFSVATSPIHFKRLMQKHLTPPNWVSSPSYIKMGFPVRRACDGNHTADPPIKCMCHNKLQKTFVYICPQCHSPVCEIPVNCPVCRLPLVDDDALKKHHRHIYSMPTYTLLPTVDYPKSYTCRFCGTDFTEGGARCDQCLSDVCYECDMFAHNKLRHCPGCL
ncbi:General transcription factor IIH subunit 2 [Perkinsus olseni]|uniref:General transcription factor IIH subunit 2 n=1 Tax=Perkinsus olseni TaxID=32597 RepID=A0A7J6MYP7_PEROL|nr:General transcription factor IIH subunit 2 [Perkinsus olseni]KAF4675991.1 General transcription factor IIH subunit 2 [Perkinsus olseni]